MNERKLMRATPMEMVLAPPEEADDAYPDGHWVRASTNLVFPSRVLYPDERVDDEVYCELRSPGSQAGGKSGCNQEDAFKAEALVLYRMLMHMGVIIAEDLV